MSQDIAVLGKKPPIFSSLKNPPKADFLSTDPTADSRQQTADSRQQTADSRQQTADSITAF